MSVENTIHDETRERVAEYLQDLFEEPVTRDGDGHFYVRYGSTVLDVSVEPYGPEEAVIQFTAYCVQGVNVSDELLRGLLAFNHDRPLGAFSLVGDDIFYSYSMLARSMQPRDLLGVIAAVATVADDYDDRIVAKYGGQTALELIEDTGGHHRSRRPHPHELGH